MASPQLSRGNLCSAFPKQRLNPPQRRLPDGVMPVLVLEWQWSGAERVEGQHPAVTAGEGVHLQIHPRQQLYGAVRGIFPPGETAARALGEDDEVVKTTLDLELGDYIKRTIFNFEKRRRIEHYRLITERTGAKVEV
jgi:hypothetical protein